MNQTATIHTLKIGTMENFVYLIQDHSSHRTAVIDPAWEIPPIIELVNRNGLQLTDILLTHSHYDHVNALDKLLLQYNQAEVHLSKSEAEFWNNPLLKTPNLHQDGDVIQLGDTAIVVLHTPGHTPGSVCFYLTGHVLTGDTLFVYGCGRCDLAGGDLQQMSQSLRRLAKLPPDTVVHPGHHYADHPTSTIMEQLTSNPSMRF